jgi:cell division protein FtsW (lipid II flippase)
MKARAIGVTTSRRPSGDAVALTYTAPAARDATRALASARRLDVTHALFLATSLVAAVAIGLAYLGRVATISGSNGVGAEPVLLVPGQRAEVLEPALGALLPSARDRRFAARELTRFLDAKRDSSETLENVAAILSIRVPAASIERANLVVYAERLRQARALAASANRPPPTDLALVTSADLAALKPSFAVRTMDAFTTSVLGWAAAYFAAFYGVLLAWRVRGIGGDRVLLAAAHVLTALGFALLLTRADPLRDSLPFVRFTQGVLVGLTLMAAVSCLEFATLSFTRYVYLPLLTAVSLSTLLLLFGDGPGTSGAKVNLGPIQPIEGIRLLMALFLAGYFARRWELLRQNRPTMLGNRTMPLWLGLPRLGYVLPVVAGVATALLLFFLQKDLGPALFLSFMFLALYAVARGRWPMALVGVAALFVGFYLGYRWEVSTTLAGRVEMWRSPWDNSTAGGDQVSQSIWALATGGAFGSGLGLGETRLIPAGQNDLILAAAGEELGLLGILAIAAIFSTMAWRGFASAKNARDDRGFFLGAALTLFLVVPVLVMAAGILGVLPLTGVVTPFLSYGGSAMAANFTALGLLAGLRQRGPSRRDSTPGDLYRPFRTPISILGSALGLCAIGLAARFAYVQTVAADDYAVRAHLGPQDDGVRRYQYNPRVLNVVRTIPRGTIYDRAGLPLATDDARVAREARASYVGLGLNVPASCADGSRCYPLGAETFHVLGNSTTRLNWSASNTAYVERDQEALLRGFDDHAASVPSLDARGRRVFVLKRDYREVVPLLRHRHEPDHPAVVAFNRRDRDLHLTLDAGLQHRVASLLSAYSRRSASGRASAVVLDPASGKLLALSSHPWPSLDVGSSVPHAVAGPGDGPLLDRSRFGSYPPGSAFKLVTATAALRRDLQLAQEQFTCSGLPNGRVGVRIPGSRAVRDDVLDRHPHGTIGMHDGLVQSCNAYFAQLALKLGPEALMDTAARLGISVVSANPTAARLRATLPQAGYGQGEVLTSPLRMARVAAAIAADGVLRDASLLEHGAHAGRDEQLLTAAGARVLGRYMRDVVLGGTGRVLRDHPAAIAGKTGTAEVAGAASHSWFVGFAPYGPSARKIAFAVLVENAGYGGQAAASLAGEIVTAAASIGLVK